MVAFAIVLSIVVSVVFALLYARFGRSLHARTGSPLLTILLFTGLCVVFLIGVSAVAERFIFHI